MDAIATYPNRENLEMPNPRPDVLIWARETAGLSLDDAAAKLGIRPARGISGADRLAELEAGARPVSRSQLLKMAKVYRRPLVAFYLNARPAKGDRGEDFRTLPARDTDSEPLVDALLRDIKARQSIVRAVLEDDEDAARLPFIGSLRMEDGAGDVLASIRQTLGIELDLFRAQGTPEAAFSLLRTRIEALGVFVLLIGNLGSHHTTLDVSAFRGFAIADPIAPFIVINDQDSRSAWSFTLLHEFAHLWLGSTGVSGAFAEGQLERFCNDVASNFLLPAQELDLVGVNRNIQREIALRLIAAFAQDRLLSRSMVAYRLYRAELVSEQTWLWLSEQFRADWRRARQDRRERDRDREGGPNYYVVRRHRLGAALLNFASRSINEKTLTPTKASKVLGVRPRSVQPLLSGAALPIGRVA